MVLLIAVAAIGFVLGVPFLYLARPSVDVSTVLMDATIWLGWLWVLTFLFAAYVEHWRSLWLLPAAPFALAWPVGMLVFGTACHPWGGCVFDG